MTYTALLKTETLEWRRVVEEMQKNGQNAMAAGHFELGKVEALGMIGGSRELNPTHK